MVDVRIRFDNVRAAEHFMDWMDDAGEQDYWGWMEFREQKEKGDITLTTITYNYSALTIEGKTGRLDN